MAAHLFNESGQMQEVDIPDIFDVLEGGEDESAVKFLLGFNAEDAASDTANEILNNNGLVQQVFTAAAPLTSPHTTGAPLTSTGAPTYSKVIEKTTTVSAGTPARVVVQVEPPNAVRAPVNTIEASFVGSAAAGVNNNTVEVMSVKNDSKPRKREPVDPSRCIYACESCGKAFTTKFNLKRHINMHCSRSREAGVPVQGPPSASQPSRKNKGKDTLEPAPCTTVAKVRRVSDGTPVTTLTGQMPAQPQQFVSNTLTPTVVTQVGGATIAGQPVGAPSMAPLATISTTSGTTLVKTVHSGTKPYQEPMTVQLAVNAQGQLTAATRPVVNTSTSAVHSSIPVSTVNKPYLPVQPLPESAVQIIQGLSGTVATAAPTQPGTQVAAMPVGNQQQRFVRIINAPQIIATQSRAGITTGATVQLQAIPVTSSSLTFPQQPLPLVQQIGNRQIVLTTSNNLTKMASKVADIMPGIAATALETANKINITPVTSSTNHNSFGLLPSPALQPVQPVPSSSTSAADLIYRSIVSSKSTSPTLTPLQAVVTSSTISSPTCGFNDGPPADLFDSEDGDALSVATTTETPTPPPSLNGDPILPMACSAIKSLPGDGSNWTPGGLLEKVVFMQQPTMVLAAPQFVPQVTYGSTDLDDGSSVTLTDSGVILGSNGGLGVNTPNGEDENQSLPLMTLPSNRFHGQLTSIPKGWLRKVVTDAKGFQKVFYYNPVGKRFSCQEEVDQYFARLGYSVPMTLFNFELPKLVDEDSDEDQDDLEDDLDEAATVTTSGTGTNLSKTVVVKVTSNAKGEATVTPATSGMTIVTKADTTMDAMPMAASTTSRSFGHVTGGQSSSLVTSTKPLLTSTMPTRVMTIGLASGVSSANSGPPAAVMAAIAAKTTST